MKNPPKLYFGMKMVENREVDAAEEVKSIAGDGDNMMVTNTLVEWSVDFKRRNLLWEEVEKAGLNSIQY